MIATILVTKVFEILFEKFIRFINLFPIKGIIP